MNNWKAPEWNKVNDREEMLKLKRQARHATWHASKQILKWSLIGVGAYTIVRAANRDNNQDCKEV